MGCRFCTQKNGVWTCWMHTNLMWAYVQPYIIQRAGSQAARLYYVLCYYLGRRPPVQNWQKINLIMLRLTLNLRGCCRVVGPQCAAPFSKTMIPNPLVMNQLRSINAELAKVSHDCSSSPLLFTSMVQWIRQYNQHCTIMVHGKFWSSSSPHLCRYLTWTTHL